MQRSSLRGSPGGTDISLLGPQGPFKSFLLNQALYEEKKAGQIDLAQEFRACMCAAQVRPVSVLLTILAIVCRISELGHSVFHYYL